MPSYRVYFTSVASTGLTVEAEDEQEAQDKASEELGLGPRLCAQCSGWGGGPSIDLSDVWEVADTDRLDGEPGE